MSALFGLVRFDGQPVEAAVLQKMGKTMLHRASDTRDHWAENSAGMGCNQLRITPEAMDEEQPVVSESGALVLVADARVDNRSELIRLLQPGVRQSPPPTDSELLLAAYLRWGAECPCRIVGDFAFAIWDNRKKILFAARDSMGVRPLYYCRSGRFFAFASEMKALFSLDGVSGQINEQHLGGYLLRLVPDATSTFYSNIFRLLPGHTLIVQGENPVLSRYWSPMDCPDIRLASDGEYEEAFAGLFQEAVHCRLRSHHPLGTSLSGGMDSSSITCVARRLLEPSVPLHTFSAIFPSLDPAVLKSIDERKYMQAVLAENDLQSHMIRADLLGPLAGLDELLETIDGPFFAPNLYIHLAMYRRAKQEHVGVFLDGIDGDTVISYGFERLPQMFLQGRWLGLVQEMRALKHVYKSSRSVSALALDYGLKPLLRPAWKRLHNITSRAGMKEVQDIFPLNPSFARRIHAGEMLARDNRWLPTINPSVEHRQGLDSPVFSDLLETTGKLAARCGIEDRYPFFDKRLMEFCVGIPPEQKLRHGWTRSILRRALHDTLPETIRTRSSKAKLSPNFNQTILNNREYLDRIFSHGQDLLAPYVDVPLLQRRYRTFSVCGQNVNEIPLQLFCAAVVYGWLQK